MEPLPAKQCKGCSRKFSPVKKSNTKIQLFHSRECYLKWDRAQRHAKIVAGQRSY